MRIQRRLLWLGGVAVVSVCLLVVVQAGELIGALYNSVTSFIGLLPVTAETHASGMPDQTDRGRSDIALGAEKKGADATGLAPQEGGKEERKLTPLPVAGVQVDRSTFTLTVRGTGRAEAWQLVLVWRCIVLLRSSGRVGAPGCWLMVAWQTVRALRCMGRGTPRCQ